MASVTAGNLQLPVGYVFLPTDQQLVAHYLLNYVLYKQCNCNDIIILNIYSTDPQSLLCGRQDAYYITPRRRMYENGSRVDRQAGDGSWKIYGQDEVIYLNEEQIVGRKRTLFYRFKHEKKNSGWTMHEYELAGELASGNETNFQEFVICRIKKSPQARASGGQKRKQCENPSLSEPVFPSSVWSPCESPVGTPRSAESNFQGFDGRIFDTALANPHWESAPSLLSSENNFGLCGGGSFPTAPDEGLSEHQEILNQPSTSNQVSADLNAHGWSCRNYETSSDLHHPQVCIYNQVAPMTLLCTVPSDSPRQYKSIIGSASSSAGVGNGSESPTGTPRSAESTLRVFDDSAVASVGVHEFVRSEKRLMTQLTFRDYENISVQLSDPDRDFTINPTQNDDESGNFEFWGESVTPKSSQSSKPEEYKEVPRGLYNEDFDYHKFYGMNFATFDAQSIESSVTEYQQHQTQHNISNIHSLDPRAAIQAARPDRLDSRDDGNSFNALAFLSSTGDENSFNVNNTRGSFKHI